MFSQLQLNLSALSHSSGRRNSPSCIRRSLAETARSCAMPAFVAVKHLSPIIDDHIGVCISNSLRIPCNVKIYGLIGPPGRQGLLLLVCDRRRAAEEKVLLLMEVARKICEVRSASIIHYSNDSSFQSGPAQPGLTSRSLGPPFRESFRTVYSVQTT